MKTYKIRVGAKILLLASVAAYVGWMLGLADQPLEPQSTPTHQKQVGIVTKTPTMVSSTAPNNHEDETTRDSTDNDRELEKNKDELAMNARLRELGKRMAKGMLKPGFLNVVQKQALADLNPKYLPFLASLGLSAEKSAEVLDLIHKRNLEVIKARAEFRSQGSNSRAALQENLEQQARIRGSYDEQIASLIGDISRYEQFQNFETGRQYDERVRLFEQQNGIQFSPDIQTKLADALLAARQAANNIPANVPLAVVDDAAIRIVQEKIEGLLRPDLVLKFSLLARQPVVRQLTQSDSGVPR